MSSPRRAAAVLLVLASAALTALLLVATVHGAKADGLPALTFVCLPVEAVMARAETLETQAGMKIERFAGEQATTFLRIVNAEEPATDWTAELVILARRADGVGTLALVTGDKGCMAAFLIGAGVLKRAVEAATGSPA